MILNLDVNILHKPLLFHLSEAEAFKKLGEILFQTCAIIFKLNPDVEQIDFREDGLYIFNRKRENFSDYL